MSKSAKKQSVQCCVWDFTIYDKITAPELKKELHKICKKFSFQLEKGEEKGKVHWQGRISCKTKLRKTQVIKSFNEFCKQFHISLTSTENRDNNFYVTKEDTRIEGPFSDQDIKIPRDIEEITKLLPWQESLKNELSEYKIRKIDIVIDTEGNNGKTIFTRYMMCHYGAQLIPMVNDYKDLLRMVMCIGAKKLYLIDMPRAINKDKLYQLYGGIETIKSGFAYDDRYEYKQLLFDPPRVCVFTNQEPNLSLLSKDKWNLWTISNKKLIKYTPKKDF